MMEFGKLVFFLPLLGALFAGFFSFHKPSKLPAIVTTACALIASILSLITAKNVFSGQESQIIHLFTLFDIAHFKSEMVIRLDNLSVVMMVLVTFVSFCVNLYSISYMDHEENFNRYFAYVSFFTFSMLVLVSSNDFIQLFFGWEGVGVASYLLISFWYKKPASQNAAMKAFIANRVGDFGLMLGIAAVFYVFGTINFSEIAANVSDPRLLEIDLGLAQFNAFNLMAVLMFLGAMGKSAQFGLHVWLPDAMEGPTPVSALIHAATMVTAGIFLIVRCQYLFDSAEIFSNVVLVISGFTVLFGALVAIFQTDIKKIIAYSTISQLSYMFLAAGTGALQLSIAHLFTHGFFKALLFLSAGSVIHATHSQDINKMPDNLHKKIPITFILFIFGTLAITGIPPTSGFYSKDSIIEHLLETFATQPSFIHGFGYIAALSTVLLTSIYSWKIIFLVFFAQNKSHDKAYESSLTMLLPMILLALITISIGLPMSWMGFFDESRGFFTDPLNIQSIKTTSHFHPAFIVNQLPLILSIGGGIFSFWYYYLNYKSPERSSVSTIEKLLNAKLYIDEIYQKTILGPFEKLSCLVGYFDKKVLDGRLVNGTRDLVYSYSNKLSNIHAGKIYSYIMWQFAVFAGMLIFFILGVK